MATNPKKPRSEDDELFPETAAKKPAKTARVEPKAVEKKKSTAKPALEKPPEKKASKPTTKALEKERADDAKAEKSEPSRPKSGSVKALEPARSLSKSGAQRGLESAPAGGSGLKLAGVGLVVVLALGGVGVALGPTLLGEGPPKNTPAVALNPAPRPTAPVVKPAPTTNVTPAATAPPPTSGGAAVAATPAPTRTPEKPPAPLAVVGKSAAELAKRSANHAAIGKALEAFEEIRKVNFTDDTRLFEDYQQKQKKEQELLDRIRALGGPGVTALKEMLVEVNDDGYRILLAKALAGMNGPEALAATGEVLGQVHDIAVQTAIVRFMPETADAAGVVAAAFDKEPNPNVRSMLLREYARRIGEPELGDPDSVRSQPLADKDAGRAVFRKAALEDQDPAVRAEAVAIIGRRGDVRDMDLMADIAKNETNLQIRQSAIVAYATTGMESSLTVLEDLARREDSLEIRASAVLAIARVGSERAIQLLDQIAQTDQREEIRQRASGFAQGLRAKIQADREEKNRIDTTPQPFNGPSPGDPPPARD